MLALDHVFTPLNPKTYKLLIFLRINVTSIHFYDRCHVDFRKDIVLYFYYFIMLYLLLELDINL